MVTVIIQHLKSQSTYKSVVNPDTQKISKSLASYLKPKSNIVQFTIGYWEYINKTDGLYVTKNSVTTDNITMITKLTFQKENTRDSIDTFLKGLIKFTNEASSSIVYVSTTGLSSLFLQMQESTKENFLLIDATVLPICIIILGFNVWSYRHMLIAFCNLALTLLLGFGLLVPVTYVFDINPFAPSIMMSLGIAVCFDYTLFLVNRFREEIISNKRSRQDAVYRTLASAGHVITLSGTILIFTFLLLISFPQTFLQSVGIVCSVVVFTSLLTNMTLGPSLLLAFECFERFELFPTSQSICCWVSESLRAKEAADGKYTAIISNKSNKISINDDDNDNTNTNIIRNDHEGNNTNQSQLVSSTRLSPTKNLKNKIYPDDTTANSTTNVDSMHSKVSLSTLPTKPTKKTILFYVSDWITKHPWLILNITAAITAPFIWQLVKIVSSYQVL